MTLDDIAREMLEDTRCDESGWTTTGRIQYIMTILKVESISLHDHYDFSHVPECPEISLVHAAGHLASLQMEFYTRANHAGLIPDDKFQIVLSQLQLDIDRISWHAEHLQKGEKTPPYFPFIN